MAKDFRLSNMQSFQHFEPDGAQALALKLGGMIAKCGKEHIGPCQEAADWWYSVAAGIAAGWHPPHDVYEHRVQRALITTATALEHLAKEFEARAKTEAKRKRDENANGGKVKPEGVKDIGARPGAPSRRAPVGPATGQVGSTAAGGRNGDHSQGDAGNAV